MGNSIIETKNQTTRLNPEYLLKKPVTIINWSVTRMAEPTMESTLEALIFASDKPVTELELKTQMNNNELQLDPIIENLNKKYETGNFAFRISKVGRGYSFTALPEYGEIIKKFLNISIKYRKLTKASIEALSIIAYKQPVKRQEVESIRGSNTQDIIKLLLEQELITVSGREEGSGALLYKTSDKFLELVGISSLEELPKPEEL
ncbi:MAG: SMC-Scp complex subunit ScpB [Planctomycetes bacterium]|nr:SMC-Scp complex subunit ScpB [Planctomycetota bacterium]